jgi:hypothetical protein
MREIPCDDTGWTPLGALVDTANQLGAAGAGNLPLGGYAGLLWLELAAPATQSRTGQFSPTATFTFNRHDVKGSLEQWGA